jgi:hypothetical protein
MRIIFLAYIYGAELTSKSDHADNNDFDHLWTYQNLFSLIN